MDPGNAISYFFKSFLLLLVFGSILFLAYMTTKVIASKVNSSMKGKYMKVIETINLSTDKKLYLVKVDNTFILLSSSGKNLELLTVVPITSFEEETEEIDHITTAELISKQFNVDSLKDIMNFKNNLQRVKNVISNIAGVKEKDRDDRTNENQN